MFHFDAVDRDREVTTLEGVEAQGLEELDDRCAVGHFYLPFRFWPWPTHRPGKLDINSNHARIMLSNPPCR